MIQALVPLGGGKRLDIAVQGAGTPILLCRPLGGTMALWGRFAERVAEDFQVVSFDPRGVGVSSDPPWDHSTRDMARDALAVLDFLGLPSAHVFGLSLGGMVATWLAHDAPARVERLVLASTLVQSTDLTLRGAGRTLRLAAALLRPGAEVAVVHRVLSARFRREHPDRVREIEHEVAATPTRRRNLAVLALAAARHDASEVIDRIRAPTLWLFGEEDRIAKPAGPSVTLPGVGHDLSLEAPELLAEQVRRFCRA